MAQPNSNNASQGSEQGPPVQPAAPGADGLTSGNATDGFGTPGQGGQDPVFGTGFDEGPDAGGRHNMEGVQQRQAQQEAAQQRRGQQTHTGPQPHNRQGQQAQHPSAGTPPNGGGQPSQPAAPQQGDGTSMFDQPQFEEGSIPPAPGVDTPTQPGQGTQQAQQPQDQPEQGGQGQAQQDPNAPQDPQNPLHNALQNGELPEDLDPQEAIEAARYFQNQAMTAQERIEQAERQAEQYEQVAPIVREMHNDPGLLQTVSEYLHGQQGGPQHGQPSQQGQPRTDQGRFAPQTQQDANQVPQQPVEVPEPPERPERPQDADPYSPEMEQYYRELDEYHQERENYQEARMQAQEQRLQQQMGQVQQERQQIQQQRQRAAQRQQAIQDARFQYGLTQGEAEQFVDDLQNGDFFEQNPQAVVQAWRATRGAQGQQAPQQQQPPAQPGGPQAPASAQAPQGYDRNPPAAQQQPQQRPQQRAPQPQRGQQQLPQGPHQGQQQSFPTFASGQSSAGQHGQDPQDDLFGSQEGPDPVWGDGPWGGVQPASPGY